MKKVKRFDPYKKDSSFQPARDYMNNFIPIMESLDNKQKSIDVMRIMDDAGKNSSILIPAIGPAKRKILEKLAKKYKPKYVYDIGTLFGYSAIGLNIPTNAHVTSIQKSRKNMIIAKKIIKIAGLSDKIRLVIGDATKTVPKFTKKLDMVLIDGYKLEYFDYLKKIEPHLKVGSVIIADNVLIFEEEVKDYLDYVRYSGIYKSKTVKTLRAFSDKEKDAMEISIKIK